MAECYAKKIIPRAKTERSLSDVKYGLSLSLLFSPLSDAGFFYVPESGLERTVQLKMSWNF